MFDVGDSRIAPTEASDAQAVLAIICSDHHSVWVDAAGGAADLTAGAAAGDSIRAGVVWKCPLLGWDTTRVHTGRRRADCDRPASIRRSDLPALPTPDQLCGGCACA